MAGGIGASGAATSRFMSAEMANARAEVKEMNQALTSVMDALKNLTEELGGRVKLGSLPQEANKTESQASRAGDKQPVGTGTYLPKGEEEASTNLLATAMAGLSQADQEELRENQKLSEFEKKMLLLSGLEASLKDVQLENAEDQAILDEFLKNMNDIRKQKKRLKFLDDKEKEYAEMLKRQEEQEQRQQQESDSESAESTEEPETVDPVAPVAANKDDAAIPKPQTLDPITLAKRQALFGNLPKDLGGPGGV
ncbi:MAG: hypothetical protein O3A01_06235 [bacterium]|nr:hypothetical protein [bacterium]